MTGGSWLLYPVPKFAIGAICLRRKIAEQIKLLRELQEIDRQIREIERAKSEIPKRRQELASARARERADLDGSKGLVKRNDDERRRLEKEIEFDRHALAPFNERTKDGNRPDPFKAADEEGDLDELFLVGTFLRRPPAELVVVPLEKQAILRAAARVCAPKAKSVPSGHAAVSDDGAGTQEPALF